MTNFSFDTEPGVSCEFFSFQRVASIAQEESRNISENVKWGKRKKYNDGYTSLAYKHFLGYDKHPTDRKKGFIINEEQAEVVILIYKLFMTGKTLTYIARFLKKSGYKTPTGKEDWSLTTLESILKNEKYKGDALICKTYVKDFLEHRPVKNNGEVDQVYVEDHHDPIIDPTQWELVQIELAKRKELKFSYTCANTFSSKLVCGDCGSFYGQKVWHSTSKYRRLVYRCNDKFKKNHIKCETPTLKEEVIVKRFLEAYSKFMEDRNQVVNDCEEMIILLDNTEDLEREKEDLLKRASDIVTLVENLIKKNATVPMHQDEFQSTYDEYDKDHSKIINKIGKLEDEIIKRKTQAKQLKVFINDLSSRPDALEEWDENVWSYLIDKATVNKDRTITFLFRNGKEITVD